jgi:hypothetical protein
LREVGGEAAVYCPVADVTFWVDAVCRLLAHPDGAPSRPDRLAQAHQFSWAQHTETILRAYLRDQRCAA